MIPNPSSMMTNTTNFAITIEALEAMTPS